MTVTIVRPETPDVAVQFTPVPTPDNFANVDEADPNDGDSTHNTSSVQGEEDELNVPNASIPAGDVINTVIVKGQFRDTGAGSVRIALHLWHDAEYVGVKQNLGTTYAERTEDFTASEAWVPADFDDASLHIGYSAEGSSTSRERQATQLWLEIDHNPPSGGSLASRHPAARHGHLIGR